MHTTQATGTRPHHQDHADKGQEYRLPGLQMRRGGRHVAGRIARRGK